MKIFLLLILLITSSLAQANCGANLIRIWTQSSGYACVPKFTSLQEDPLNCFPNQMNPFEGFPGPLYQTTPMPWWAYQGNLHFPNLHYPGPWTYPHIQAEHYPGKGEVFAAKPNVYVESIHAEKKFEMRFVSENPQFLATTPPLGRENEWRGKILKDKFEVEGINYDYLFYDIRLPQEKMQFVSGVCATRDAAIDWMLKDLKEMKYPVIALQDFEEHWRVKIPEYPFYCIYPQYNRQLDDYLPVHINLDQKAFLRSLYVLVPYKEELDFERPQFIPFPTQETSPQRPAAKITRETMFKEWGVAFLGQ